MNDHSASTLVTALFESFYNYDFTYASQLVTQILIFSSMAPQPFGLEPLFQFFYTAPVGLFGRGISPSQGRYLHMTTQTQNKGTQTSMPRMSITFTSYPQGLSP
jgi:hypothetical protein